MATTLPAERNVLGAPGLELERLVEQSQFFGELTEDVLRRAGVGRGMRVLDAGCGWGEVSFLAASLVGEDGWVTGVDRSPEAVAVAQDRAALARLPNVRFLQADLETDELGGAYDAVVARLLLFDLRDPVGTLARMARSVRPGGLVVLQEPVLSSARTVPEVPLYAQVLGWLRDTFAAAQLDADLGLRLHHVFRAAGLPAPQLSLGARVAHADDGDVHWHAAATMRSLLPVAERLGVARADEVDIDSLADRLRAEALAADAVIFMPDLVGAWARVPEAG